MRITELTNKLTKLRAIQQKAGVSLKSVRTGIQKLERLGVVAHQVAHQGSLLKLAGWLDCRLYTPPSGTLSGTQGAQQVAHQVAHPTDASNPDVDLIHTLSQAKAGTASGTLSGTPTKEKEREKEKERTKEKEKEKEKEKYIYYSRQNSDESLPSNDVERLEQPSNRAPVKEIIQAN
jgi:hypothetical protein